MKLNVLSKAIAATALAIAASSAAASNLGPIYGTTNLQGSFAAGQTFNTAYTFTTLAGPFSGTLINNYTSQSGFINNFSASLTGPDPSVTVTPWFSFNAPGVFQLRFQSANLTAGTYTLNVSGTATTDNSSFVGSITTPVPEPHEWAMMLAGLGLVGWAARRSKRQTGASPALAAA